MNAAVAQSRGHESRAAILAWPNRLDLERRLLSALFRWPTLVDLDPAAFLAPAHGALFQAMQDVQTEFPVEPLADQWRWHDYDDAQLVLVAIFLKRNGLLALFTHLGGLKTYVVGSLFAIKVGPRAIEDLIAAIAACPRCGH